LDIFKVDLLRSKFVPFRNKTHSLRYWFWSWISFSFTIFFRFEFDFFGNEVG